MTTLEVVVCDYSILYVVKEKRMVVIIDGCKRKAKTYVLNPKRQRIGRAIARKSKKVIASEALKDPKTKNYLASGDDWERIGQRGESHGF